MSKLLGLFTAGFFALYGLIAHATADPEFASTSPQLATFVKENVFSGIFNTTVLTAIAAVLALVMVVALIMKFIRRAGGR